MKSKYKWRCKCGEDGFVDLGKGAKNRFPCSKCYADMQLKRPIKEKKDE